jgi:hypothetical protein
VNNPLLFNAVFNGITGAASRTCTVVSSSTFVAIDNFALHIAGLVDAEIPSIVGGSTTSQAELLSAIVNGAFRGTWPTNLSGDFSSFVDNIVTQFVTQAANLAAISNPSLLGVDLPFDYSTTTLVLGAVTVGDVISLAQLSVIQAFSAGSLIELGTSANHSLFLSIPGTSVGAFQNPESVLIDTADIMLLSVSTVGTVGSGHLFYEV